MPGVIAGDFFELFGRYGTRSARFGDDDFRSEGEQPAGDFVHGFVAKSAVDEPDFARGEIFGEKICQFMGRGWVVRAVQIDVGVGLEFFEAAGPHGVGDSGGDGFVRDAKASFRDTGGGDGVEGVLQLELAGERWGDFERPIG